MKLRTHSSKFGRVWTGVRGGDSYGDFSLVRVLKFLFRPEIAWVVWAFNCVRYRKRMMTPSKFERLLQEAGKAAVYEQRILDSSREALRRK